MRDQPSPTLKAAIAEMEAIAEKYDIGAYLILASKEHGEYLLHWPKWSKAQFETTPEGRLGIRFKSKGKDEDRTIASTIHMIQVLQQTSGELFMGMDKLLDELKARIIIEGGPQKV
jgi:hypothetical protein